MKKRRASKKTETENQRCLRAIVISGDAALAKQKSNALDPDRERESEISDARFILPPYEPDVLALLPENSSELIQCIEAMEINIEGFGQRVVEREMTDEQKTQNEAAIKKERTELKGFIDITNPDDNLTSIRRKLRKDIEIQGNGFWEVLTSKDGQLSGLNYLRARHMRITKQDREFTEIKIRYLDEDLNWITKTFFKRFRRFVQRVGSNTTYFKEWDDPRTIDKNSGLPIERPTQKDMKENAATGAMHFKIQSGRTSYGLPRIIGNLFSIFGSRASDVINFQTFKNNNVPSMVVTVSNGMLTTDTIDRIEEYVNSHIKRSDNWSKFLILEGESQDEEAQNAGAMKIDLKPLTSSQHTDQLFQAYDTNNSEKIRRSFRLPQIFVGKTENINRAATESSRRLAEEQVFGPEREEMDRRINRLLSHFGIKYHVLKSNSPNVTDDAALTKIISGAEKSGALTPNFTRTIIGDILNKEIPPIETTDKFDPNIPFSLTMAEAVKKRDGIAPNQGQLGDGEENDKPDPNPNPLDDPDDDDDDDQNKIRSFFEFMENPAREFDHELGMNIFADVAEDDDDDEEVDAR